MDQIIPPIEMVSLGQAGGIGKYLITKGQWNAVCKLPRQNLHIVPSHYLREEYSFYPVDDVSWLQTQEFCERLYQESGIRYRLPTVAEWDLAAIANPRPKRDYVSQSILPVHKQIPNEIGVYGMFGSYWQWLQSGGRHDSLTRPCKGGTFANIRDMEDIAYVSATHRSAALGFRVFSASYEPENFSDTLTWLTK